MFTWSSEPLTGLKGTGTQIDRRAPLTVGPTVASAHVRPGPPPEQIPEKPPLPLRVDRHCFEVSRNVGGWPRLRLRRIVFEYATQHRDILSETVFRDEGIPPDFADQFIFGDNLTGAALKTKIAKCVALGGGRFGSA